MWKCSFHSIKMMQIDEFFFFFEATNFSFNPEYY